MKNIIKKKGKNMEIKLIKMSEFSTKLYKKYIYN